MADRFALMADPKLNFGVEPLGAIIFALTEERFFTLISSKIIIRSLKNKKGMV